MIINIICPVCTQNIEHDSMFTVRLGDCFLCTCGEKLIIKQLGNPSMVEVVKKNKYSTLKDKL